MRGAAAIGAVLLALEACGGGAASPDGAAGRGGASAGTGGLAGTGSGGTAGGGAGQSGGLPACAITTRPQDPTDASAASGSCNTIEYGGGWVVAAPFQSVDGGALLDGGAVEGPQGGTIRDGDYDLVGYLYVSGGYQTRRTIRVFGGGAYIEWRSESEATDSDAGITDVRFDTSASPTAGKLASLTVTCAVGISLDDYAFTAAGDELVIFAFRSGSSTLDDVYTYQRTCAR